MEYATDCRQEMTPPLAELALLEKRHFWFQSRVELVAWALSRHHPGARSVLEVGCGTGFLLAGLGERLPRLRRFGSDVFAEAVRHARSNLGPDVPLLRMDARAIAFVDAVDVLGAFDVLEHIEEDDRVLAEARKALRSRGLLVITVPQHKWLWSHADVDAKHVRRYSAKDLHHKIESAGFDVVWSSSFVTLLLPAIVVARFLPVCDHDPLAELRLPGLLNTALGWVMRLERLAITHGVRFPVGASRLVVARRQD